MLSSNCPLPETNIPSGTHEHNRIVALSPKCHGHLDFWRWLSDEGLAAWGGSLTARMPNLVCRPPSGMMLTSASKTAVGGLCVELRLSWRYDLSGKKRQLFEGAGFSFNVIKLLGTVLAHVMVVLRGNIPVATGDRVFLTGGDPYGVKWVNRCRRGAEPRSGPLIRQLGMLEIARGCFYSADHVPGVVNVEAGGISRWAYSLVHPRL